MIGKEIRERLGIEPGWLALQRIINGHVEIYFVPPAHNGSLLGSLAPYTDVVVPPDEEWAKVREKAWYAAPRGKVERMDRDLRGGSLILQWWFGI